MEVDPAVAPEGRPANDGLSVRYGRAPGQRMYSIERGKQQYLPNGGLLITEAEGGRVFEVGSRGDLLWEFVNRYDQTSVAIVTQATRYPPDYFTVRDWTCP